MADGNISVDVAKNESYYTGDFKVLADSPKSIRTNFTNVMRDITHIASQVDSEENQVSAGAAKSTGTPVSRSIHDVTTGTQSTDLVLSAMQPINECMQSIKVLMEYRHVFIFILVCSPSRTVPHTPPGYSGTLQIPAVPSPRVSNTPSPSPHTDTDHSP